MSEFLLASAWSPENRTHSRPPARPSSAVASPTRRDVKKIEREVCSLLFLEGSSVMLND